jgi:hypothetical protein
MPASFARETIRRFTYPTKSVYGVDVIDTAESPTDAIDIAGCWLEPTQSEVVRNGRTAVLRGWKGTAPSGTVLDPTQHLVGYRDDRYELAAPAVEIPSPAGALAEVLFELRLWEG